MPNVKTAISIQQGLFDQAESLARKMKVSRSRLFGLALQDFLRRQENRAMLSQIDAAYADEPDPTERTLRRKVRRSHRRLVAGQW